MIEFMNRLSTWGHVLALILASIIGGSALIAVSVPWKVNFSKRKRSTKYSVTMSTLLLAACAIISADAVTLPASTIRAKTASEAQRSVIVIDLPEPPLPGNPPPLVTCQTLMQGSGDIPAGDVLVIGNREFGTETYYYQPVVTWDEDRWSAEVYFSTRKGAGQLFNVTAVVMPATMEKYLVTVYHTVHSPAIWWAAPDSVPAPAYVAAAETVQRSHSEVGCT
jgi:hypothetical protein